MASCARLLPRVFVLGSTMLFALGCGDFPASYRGSWATDDNRYGLSLSLENGKSKAVFRSADDERSGFWSPNRRGEGFYVHVGPGSAFNVLLRSDGVLDVRPAHDPAGLGFQMRRVAAFK